MSAVKNLDSKNSTLITSQDILGPRPNPDLESFVSGNFDVRAKFDFRIKSPWKFFFRAFFAKLLG
jgi:hypothetical protein